MKLKLSNYIARGVRAIIEKYRLGGRATIDLVRRAESAEEYLELCAELDECRAEVD